MRVSAFHGIADAQECGEFLDAQAVRLIEFGVGTVLDGWGAVAVVAGKHSDDLHISPRQTEDF